MERGRLRQMGVFGAQGIVAGIALASCVGRGPPPLRNLRPLLAHVGTGTNPLGYHAPHVDRRRDPTSSRQADKLFSEDEKR